MTGKAATCGEAGYTVDKCEYCGREINKTTIAATGAHSFGEWVDTTEGKQERVCSVCGAVETRDKPADDSGSGSDTPTPSDEGSAPERCEKCGFVHANRTGIFAKDGVFCKIVSFFKRIFRVFGG